MKQKLASILVCTLYSLGLPLVASAETVLERIQQTGALNVGMRVDAVPFGYLAANGDLAGYCLNFFDLLKERVKQQLNNDFIVVRLQRTDLSNRFELVKNNVIVLECGPNTITEQEQVGFSAPFFISGTQFLVKNENSNLVNLKEPLASLTIGLIQGTTTEKLVANQYPSAEIRRFQGVTGRTRGVQAVEQDRIDAFASDGILLLGEISQQRLSLANYQLIPEEPLTCDYYGMILPKGEPQWKALVDSVIQSPQAQQILSQGMSSYLRQVENFCPS